MLKYVGLFDKKKHKLDNVAQLLIYKIELKIIKRYITLQFYLKNLNPAKVNNIVLRQVG